MADGAVIAVAAATVERGFLTGQLHAGNSAVVIASLADEGGEVALALDDLLKSFEAGLLAIHYLPGKQGGANGATHLAVLGHGQRSALKLLVKSSHHRLVVKDGAGKDDLISKFTVAHHFGEVVLGDGVGQAGGDDFKRHLFLLGGGNCLSHKGGAPGAQVNGIWGIKGQMGELSVVHGYAEHLRQLVNKASGAGGASLVHLIVNNHAIPLDDQLGVLSPNLDNIRLRVYIGGSPGLRGDFVFDEVSPDEAADQVPPGTGNSHAGNIDSGGTI